MLHSTSSLRPPDGDYTTRNQSEIAGDHCRRPALRLLLRAPERASFRTISAARFSILSLRPASFGRLDFSSWFELYSEMLSFTQTNLFSVDIANRRMCDSTPKEFAG